MSRTLAAAGALARIVWPRRAFAYFRACSIERLKKFRPIKVGSPPCQAMVTSGV